VENVLHTWGGIFIGEWVADQPHGRGTLQLRNGQVREFSVVVIVIAVDYDAWSRIQGFLCVCLPIIV